MYALNCIKIATAIDPAMGTAGFLIESARYIQEHQETELLNAQKKRKFNSEMFYGCDNLVNLNLGNFTADSAKNLSKMFINCTKLESLDLSNFNIINASKINQASMFRNCPKLKSIKCKQSFKEMCDTYHTIMGMSTYSSIVWDIVD